MNPLNEPRRAPGMALRIDKPVASYPVSQMVGLPDVKKPVVVAVEKIDARLRRNAAEKLRAEPRRQRSAGREQTELSGSRSGGAERSHLLSGPVGNGLTGATVRPKSRSTF